LAQKLRLPKTPPSKASPSCVISNFDFVCRPVQRPENAPYGIGRKSSGLKSKSCCRDLIGVQLRGPSSLRFWGEDYGEGIFSARQTKVSPNGATGFVARFPFKHAAPTALRINAKHIFSRKREANQLAKRFSVDPCADFRLNSKAPKVRRKNQSRYG